MKDADKQRIMKEWDWELQSEKREYLVELTIYIETLHLIGKDKSFSGSEDDIKTYLPPDIYKEAKKAGLESVSLEEMVFNRDATQETLTKAIAPIVAKATRN